MDATFMERYLRKAVGYVVSSSKHCDNGINGVETIRNDLNGLRSSLIISSVISNNIDTSMRILLSHSFLAMDT